MTDEKAPLLLPKSFRIFLCNTNSQNGISQLLKKAVADPGWGGGGEERYWKGNRRASFMRLYLQYNYPPPPMSFFRLQAAVSLSY